MIYSIFFSPTGGTEGYVQYIAAGLAERTGADVFELNQTVPESRKENYSFGPDDVIVIGAPCYAGTLPSVEGLFSNLKGNGTPCLVNISFGNRAYDMAVSELRDFMEERGFKVIGGAGWSAVHSFTELVGAGRPDEEDKKLLEEFIDGAYEILEGGNFEGKLKIRGEELELLHKRLAACPETTDACRECLECVSHCPTGAITKENFKLPDENLCIGCVACHRYCPNGARNIEKEGIVRVRKFLEEKCIERAAAEIFLLQRQG